MRHQKLLFLLQKPLQSMVALRLQKRSYGKKNNKEAFKINM
jgi:hypothetical protein